jgi:hypothetical protein
VRRIVLAALIVVSSGISAHAQTTQVWPEISLFTRLNDRIRFYFLASISAHSIAVCGRASHCERCRKQRKSRGAAFSTASRDYDVALAARDLFRSAHPRQSYVTLVPCVRAISSGRFEKRQSYPTLCAQSGEQPHYSGSCQPFTGRKSSFSSSQDDEQPPARQLLNNDRNRRLVDHDLLHRLFVLQRLCGPGPLPTCRRHLGRIRFTTE